MKLTGSDFEILKKLVSGAITDSTLIISQIRNAIDVYEIKGGVFKSDWIQDHYKEEYERNKKRLEEEIKIRDKLKEILNNMN